MKTLLWIVGALSLGLVLCSFGLSYGQPKVKFEKYEVRQVTLQDTKVDFDYTVDNPNPLGLEGIAADYEIWLGTHDIPNGVPAPFSGKDVKFDVKAKTVSPFTLPVTINYLGFFHSAGDVAKEVLAGHKSVPFAIRTVFHLDLKILKFNIPVTAQGDLPLPEVSSVPSVPKLPSLP